MTKENNALGDTFPDLILTDQELFRSAFSISKSKNYCLLPIVNDFMKLPGQNHTRSVFSEFSSYLILKYPNYIHDENTNHLAFGCENVPIDNNFRPYAIAIVENYASYMVGAYRMILLNARLWHPIQNLLRHKKHLSKSPGTKT